MLQLVILLAFVAAKVAADAMPAPFTRELKLTSPYMTGNDVIIAQTLLKRDSAVDQSLVVDGIYGEDSAKACQK